MDRTLTWFKMPVETQLANIGSEVNRAIQWKRRGNETRAVNFCNKAIEFLNLIKEDPKNIHRRGELDFCIEELKDFFLGDNIWGTTDETLIKYYDAFIS